MVRESDMAMMAIVIGDLRFGMQDSAFGAIKNEVKHG